MVYNTVLQLDNLIQLILKSPLFEWAFFIFVNNKCMEFKNKNVVITGASRGIGLGIAKKLASEGANIAVLAKTDTHHPKLQVLFILQSKKSRNMGLKQ